MANRRSFGLSPGNLSLIGGRFWGITIFPMEDERPTPDSSPPEKETSADLASGFLVGGGRFSLLRELARGGMGVVWLAHDERLMAPVALKFLTAEVRADLVALNDLRLETKKSRMLSHPNIIRIYDLYESPDEPAFISMEYVDGPSLWILRTQQPQGFFYWDFLKPIVQQLCEALDYAHSEKVIHRDLKPSNMLLDERKRLRLADFGIAAWAFESSGDDEERRPTTGTLCYMSPQQIEGTGARATDDIYALGATLYELLSGQPPFYQNDILYQVRNVLATPLPERLADLEVENEVPPNVSAMIMACLSKDAEKRPQTARAVLEWIELQPGPPPAKTSFVPPVAPPPAVAPAAIPVKSPASRDVIRVTLDQITAADPVGALEPDEEQEETSPPPRQRSLGGRLAMLLGFAAMGVLAWLAWGHFMPNMTGLPVAVAPPKTNAATVAVTNAKPKSLRGTPAGIELGQINSEKGLRLLTGLEGGAATVATNMGGKECRLLLMDVRPRPHARCYFQILPAHKLPGTAHARIKVEYFAAAAGILLVQFDGSSKQTPRYSNGGRKDFNGEGTWKTTYFDLDDARFRNGEKGGADFSLNATCPEFYLRSVTLSYDQ